MKTELEFCTNRKAYHDYSIVDTIEVGIVLSGMEVKSIRNKMISISGAYVQVLKGELWLIGSSIAGSNYGFNASYKSDRQRKLLCHKKQIVEIKHSTEAKGLTAVPLKVYEKNGRIKLLVGIARGKNLVDKRQSLKNKTIDRDISRYR